MTLSHNTLVLLSHRLNQLRNSRFATTTNMQFWNEKKKTYEEIARLENQIKELQGEC